MTALCGSGLRAGALFSGIGGFCMGFHRVGVPTLWAIEMDPFAVATYKANFPIAHTLQRDVRGISVDDTNLEPVDILHAGFPCQSFSQAGGRRGFHDPRGQLFYEIIRIINEFRENKPKALILENAPYLRYGEGGAWFLELQREIQKAGYIGFARQIVRSLMHMMLPSCRNSGCGCLWSRSPGSISGVANSLFLVTKSQIQSDLKITSIFTVRRMTNIICIGRTDIIG